MRYKEQPREVSAVSKKSLRVWLLALLICILYAVVGFAWAITHTR